MNNQIEGISSRVTRDLLNLVFKSMHYLVIGETAGTIAFTILLWHGINHTVLLSWTVLSLTLNGAARYLMTYLYQHSKPIKGADISRWYRIFISSAFMNGIIWMLAAFLYFFSTSDIYTLIIIMALLVVIGAASAAFTPITASFIAVAIPVFIGLLTICISAHSLMFFIIIAGLSVYIVVLSHYALFFSNSFNSLLWLRHKHDMLFENMLIAKKGLESANLRLTNEVKARHEAEKALEVMATHDSLTGLPNRNLLQLELEKALAHSRRYKTYTVLLFLDLDNFKNVNDTFGHGSGDKLLKILAKRLQKTVRKTDILARIGGDEFIVTLCDINDTTNINHIARKICHVISKRCIINNHDIDITTSIGISIFPKDGDSIESLLQTADIALYQAKSSGRNKFVFFREENENPVSRRLTQ